MHYIILALHSIKACLLKALAFTLLILAPVEPVMIVLGILIGLDFFTGVYKAYRKGEKIQSKKMAHTIAKTILYQVAVLSAFLTETYILNYLPLMKIVAGFIALTELKSLSENIFDVTGINFYRAIKSYLNRHKEKDDVV